MVPIATVLAVALAVAMPDEAGKATEMEKSLRTAVREPITSERRQAQQRAAASVWLVEKSVRLQGEFKKIDDGELVGTDTVTTVEYWGSSVAVSADGYLLTNRHVADARYLVACACLDKKKMYGEMHVQSARIDFAFVDFAGEAVPGRVNVVPAEGVADLCDDPMSSIWSNADDYPARIVALDELSDLALAQLGLTDIPFMEPTATRPEQGDSVAGLGYDGRNQRLVRLTGQFVSHCADAMDEPDDKDDDIVFLPQPMPMVESTVPVRKGMSGGPLVTAAMTFAGINTLSDVVCGDDEPCPTENAQSFAVPGPYAVAWFRWVTGASPDRPALCSSGGHRIELFDPFGANRHR